MDEEIQRKMALIFDEPDGLVQQIQEVNKQRYIAQVSAIEKNKQISKELDEQIQGQSQQMTQLQEQIEKEVNRQQLLDGALKHFENTGKALSDESKKFVTTITQLTEKMELQKKSFNTQNATFETSDKENQRLLKELENWQKNLKQIEQDNQKKEQRTQKLTEELATQRLAIKDNKPAPAEDLNKVYEKLLQDNKRLAKQRAEVMQVFRKQAKIIEVIRKQKIHLEASASLDLSEADFSKIVDFQI